MDQTLLDVNEMVLVLKAEEVRSNAIIRRPTILTTS